MVNSKNRTIANIMNDDEFRGLADKYLFDDKEDYGSSLFDLSRDALLMNGYPQYISPWTVCTAGQVLGTASDDMRKYLMSLMETDESSYYYTPEFKSVAMTIQAYGLPYAYGFPITVKSRKTQADMLNTLAGIREHEDDFKGDKSYIVYSCDVPFYLLGVDAGEFMHRSIGYVRDCNDGSIPDDIWDILPSMPKYLTASTDKRSNVRETSSVYHAVMYVMDSFGFDVDITPDHYDTVDADGTVTIDGMRVHLTDEGMSNWLETDRHMLRSMIRVIAMADYMSYYIDDGRHVLVGNLLDRLNDLMHDDSVVSEAELGSELTWLFGFTDYIMDTIDEYDERESELSKNGNTGVTLIDPRPRMTELLASLLTGEDNGITAMPFDIWLTNKQVNGWYPDDDGCIQL